MKANSGVTLLELIVTMAILAVVASVAVPPMTHFVQRYRAEIQRHRLFDLIALARGKAYSEGKIYTLCPLDTDSNCNNDWSNGAQLFVDTDGDHQRDADEMLERILEPMPAGASLHWNTLHGSYLQFRPDGRPQNQTGNFAYCPPDSDAEQGWIIVLNATGRPYIGRDSDGNGLVENGSGSDLTCTAA
ncbi:GspH/FimT family pseudopilin [Microbulbifer sp. SAOS-129_SWC]|uniref:GspH/FimT family pseudopilin n=1 Tax=Microbulbifer sp. SAOS-129_SWC TaxID=3145235 RepID=UPI0032170F79